MRKKTDKPFFSIIIPTLNEENYISGLLKDIARQKKAPTFEVFVVDAKSEDKTKEKVLDFANKLNIKFIISSRRNLSFQRNLGVKKASGKYIILFDADVRIKTNFLLNAYKITQTNSNLIIVPLGDEKQKSIKYSNITALTNNFMSLSQYIGRPFIYGACLIIERNFFIHMGGFVINLNQDKNILFPEDIDFMIRSYQAGIKGFYSDKLVFTPSYRRFEKEGWIRSLAKYIPVSSELILRGKANLFSMPYEMGGRAHERDANRPQKNLNITLLKKLEKIGSQLNELLGIEKI